MRMWEQPVPCAEQASLLVQFQSTYHYIVYYYAKKLHVRLGVANDRLPLTWWLKGNRSTSACKNMAPASGVEMNMHRLSLGGIKYPLLKYSMPYLPTVMTIVALFCLNFFLLCPPV